MRNWINDCHPAVLIGAIVTPIACFLLSLLLLAVDLRPQFWLVTLIGIAISYLAAYLHWLIRERYIRGGQ